MTANPEVIRIAELVAALARKHNFDAEQCRAIADVIYQSRKAMEGISFEEWQEYWRKK